MHGTHSGARQELYVYDRLELCEVLVNKADQNAQNENHHFVGDPKSTFQRQNGT